MNKASNSDFVEPSNQCPFILDQQELYESHYNGIRYYKNKP